MLTDHETEAALLERFPMPKRIARLAGRCRGDLFAGPLYFNDEGETCCHLDEGARQFDFSRGCELLRRWADRLPDPLYVLSWVPEVTDVDPEFDQAAFTLDRSLVLEVLFGRQLAEYVR